MPEQIAYDVAGELTALGPELQSRLGDLPTDVIDLCRVAQAVLITPPRAAALGLPEERQAEKSLRYARAIVELLTTLDPTPLTQPRPERHRVVGTCRHFALLSCAFLRERGVAARVRCGFASYFVPGDYVDHWIVEYRHPSDPRWIRVDAEWLGRGVVDAPEDLGAGAFLTGGEAWTLCRAHGADPARFGVFGAPQAWGIAEVRGNAMRDLAALNKVEMLPWDEWGLMRASYQGQTGPDFDARIDTVAATCAADDPVAIRALYADEDLTVPRSLVT